MQMPLKNSANASFDEQLQLPASLLPSLQHNISNGDVSAAAFYRLFSIFFIVHFIYHRQLLVWFHLYILGGINAAIIPAIATDITAAARGPSVCLSVTLVHRAKAVGRNEIPFGRDTDVVPSNMY